MKFYTDGVLDQHDILTFERVRSAVLALPDDILDDSVMPITLSCHILARAIAGAFELPCVDGYYWNSAYPHSWNMTPSGMAIIDAYPIASFGGPRLLDCASGSPQRLIYTVKDIKHDILREIDRDRFMIAVEIVACELTRIRESLSALIL